MRPRKRVELSSFLWGRIVHVLRVVETTIFVRPCPFGMSCETVDKDDADNQKLALVHQSSMFRYLLERSSFRINENWQTDRWNYSWSHCAQKTRLIICLVRPSKLTWGQPDRKTLSCPDKHKQFVTQPQSYETTVLCLPNCFRVYGTWSKG